MAKLPKKYIKAAGGINKKAWRLYRAAGNPKKTRSRTMAKKKKSYRRKGKNIMGMFTSKNAIDGYISEGGKFVAHTFLGVNNPLVDAAISGGVGFIRNNNTLVGIAAVEGLTALLGGNIGATGSVNGGYES
jgi:hypothetical protein